jgi:histidine triad (HIT) family protein
MIDCVFCKIINGEIPAYKVYENDYVLAFLDIAPITKGHTLVIPKTHQESVSALDPQFQSEMMQVASSIGRALTKVDEYDGFNLHLSNGECAGQVVPHAHLHVVPRSGTDGFYWNSRNLDYQDGEQSQMLDKIQQKLKA